MTARVFVDTNVLVYSRDARDAVKHERARAWVEEALNGEETVIGMALKRTGENTKKVIDALKAKWETLKRALPKGVEVIPFYDQTQLVEKAVGTAERALIEGGVLVTLVLFFFLGEIRSALVVVTAVPDQAIVPTLAVDPIVAGATRQDVVPRGASYDTPVVAAATSTGAGSWRWCVRSC